MSGGCTAWSRRVGRRFDGRRLWNGWQGIPPSPPYAMRRGELAIWHCAREGLAGRKGRLQREIPRFARNDRVPPQCRVSPAARGKCPKGKGGALGDGARHKKRRPHMVVRGRLAFWRWLPFGDCLYGAIVLSGGGGALISEKNTQMPLPMMMSPSGASAR